MTFYHHYLAMASKHLPRLGNKSFNYFKLFRQLFLGLDFLFGSIFALILVYFSRTFWRGDCFLLILNDYKNVVASLWAIPLIKLSLLRVVELFKHPATAEIEFLGWKSNKMCTWSLSPENSISSHSSFRLLVREVWGNRHRQRSVRNSPLSEAVGSSSSKSGYTSSILETL